MSGKDVLLKIRDFGPIVDGLIEIKPLTIFVGPNNTGKSYIAMLYYALIRGLRETILSYTIVRRYRIPLSSSIIFASSFARLTQLLSDESKRISLLMRRNSFKDLDQVSDILYTSFEEKILPVTTDVVCPNCGAREAYYWSVQTRSADEPMTQFFKCKKCGHTWREYV